MACTELYARVRWGVTPNKIHSIDGQVVRKVNAQGTRDNLEANGFY